VKIAGTAVLHAPADRVWAALNDPAVLVRTIPGCSALEPNGPDRYRMTVTAGVASIKGVYSGEVALHDQQPPGSFRLRASGAGAPGTVRADVLVRLEDAADGTTSLSYDADAVVGGMVGGVGQRMLTGVAKKTAGEFFKAVDGVLTGAPVAAEAPVPVPAAPAVAPAAPVSRISVGADGFVVGAVVGAAAALLGVLVGAVVARRR
jgi:carbon monoxide dehydrogenase subunit G